MAKPYTKTENWKTKIMTEEIDFILDSTQESMIGSIAHLEKNS
jgi:hypothetical protein